MPKRDFSYYLHLVHRYIYCDLSGPAKEFSNDLAADYLVSFLIHLDAVFLAEARRKMNKIILKVLGE